MSSLTPIEPPPRPVSPSGISPTTLGMLNQIIGMLEKSQQETSALRTELSSLRQSHQALEKQLSTIQISSTKQSREKPQSLASPNGLSPISPSTGFNPLAGSPQSSPRIVARLGKSPSPLLNPPTLNLQPPDSPLLRPRDPRPQHDIPKFWAVVPAGGSGTRLWPLSREGFPKFLLDLTGRGRTLIQNTWDRLLPLSSPSRLMVVTGSRHAAHVSSQLPDLAPGNLLAEPSPRESAAAIGLAAAILAKRDPEIVFGSFAADHMISGEEAFEGAVIEAVAVAREGHLVTIGIAPSSPATGFGYIQLGDKLNVPGSSNARHVVQFKEKPDAKTAAKYLARGDYRWNAGMFVCKASVLMDLLKQYSPEIHDGLTRIADVVESPTASDEEKLNIFEEVWHNLPKIAIDNAVAEPAAADGKVAVINCTFGWDDVGDYASLGDLLPWEKNGPRILGDKSLVVTEKVAGGLVVPASGRTIAVLGVDDLVVVDAPDAILITSHARSQEVKKLVARVKDAGKKELL